MSEAEVLRCPVCGAPTRANAPRCEFCKAPLASVHCSACFALNPATAQHCSGCGEKLGLEPLDVATELSCPHCQAPFRAFGASAGRLSECTSCGGQFVEHALLTELLERRELHRVVTRALPPRANPLDKPVTYLRCPVCKSTMNRNNFGGTSGIVVDVCARHGIWFGPGELPRILEFVQAGGLDLARHRAQQAKVERARSEQLSVATLHAPSSNEELGSELASTIADGVAEVLTHIGDAFRRLR